MFASVNWVINLWSNVLLATPGFPSCYWNVCISPVARCWATGLGYICIVHSQYLTVTFLQRIHEKHPYNLLARVKLVQTRFYFLPCIIMFNTLLYSTELNQESVVEIVIYCIWNLALLVPWNVKLSVWLLLQLSQIAVHINLTNSVEMAMDWGGCSSELESH